MSFEFDEYWNALVGRALVFVILGILAFAWGIIVYIYPRIFPLKTHRIKLFRKNRKLHLYWTIFSFLALSLMGVCLMNRNLIFEKPSAVLEMIGVITSIDGAKSGWKWYYEGERVDPSYITINDERYYIMNIGGFEIGDQIIISYLPKSKIVLEIHYTSTD